MTRNSLIDEIAEKTERTRKEAKQMLDAVLATITGALGRGRKADLRGFGSFQLSDRKERQGRNPRTGETMTIPARKAAVFRPGRELAERVNTAGVVVDADARG
jgi:DNA-binding protein HU-beta